MDLTPDERAEILSYSAQRDDVGRSIVVSLARWYRLRDVDGAARYASTPHGHGYTLDDAVDAIVSRARREQREGGR